MYIIEEKCSQIITELLSERIDFSVSYSPWSGSIYISVYLRNNLGEFPIEIRISDHLCNSSPPVQIINEDDFLEFCTDGIFDIEKLRKHLLSI